jgi:hypothetical protein
MLAFSLFCLYLIIACLFVYYLRNSHRQKWWLKIVTQEPVCTYYFGPFDSSQEAELNQKDYLQDIEEEGAEGISVKIEQGKPQNLTIFEN